MKSDIAQPSLAGRGRRWIEWAGQQMPVLRLVRERFAKQKALRGVRIACCLHVTSETANLMIALKAGGASVALCASNPLSTSDAVAAALVKHYGIPVAARHGENRTTYYNHIRGALSLKPQVTIDDGADLVSAVHQGSQNGFRVMGGTEETTTGIIRLRSLEREGKLRYPIIAVNDAMTKHFFDNRYGTGQSTMDGIMRATNCLIAGKRFVVVGYGWCGRGVAMRARGLGARVIVVEVDEVKALEAVMDGFEVLPMKRAAARADILVTVTGNYHVVAREHIAQLPDGAIVANAGHFNVEIDTDSLGKMSRSRRAITPDLIEYTLRSKRRIYLLGEGRLVNLACANGHPPQVMDMSFANQALAAEHIVNNATRLSSQVYTMPEQIDREIARLKLRSMGVSIDRLTPAQTKYLASWTIGT